MKFLVDNALSEWVAQGLREAGYDAVHVRELRFRVKVNAVDTDRYGRTVADLYINDGLVQLQQVKAGWVWANGKYKSDCAEWGAVAAAEQEARQARRGIWARSPVEPWEWRNRGR